MNGIHIKLFNTMYYSTLNKLRQWHFEKFKLGINELCNNPIKHETAKNDPTITITHLMYLLQDIALPYHRRDPNESS